MFRLVTFSMLFYFSILFSFTQNLYAQDTQTVKPPPHNLIKWVLIKGGSFMMGSIDNDNYSEPLHKVKVNHFYISQTEVTVEQYRKCVDAGGCSEPMDKDFNDLCNWGYPDRDQHPINCVDWYEARDFAQWVGGDLPSEAQWEYAARSGGRDIKYPWGNEYATCKDVILNGCGYLTRKGCSKARDKTKQGLCDMGGNVHEWVLDEWHDSYIEAPANGQAWCKESECSRETYVSRVLRGGSWLSSAEHFYITDRRALSQSLQGNHLGFRVSKKGASLGKQFEELARERTVDLKAGQTLEDHEKIGWEGGGKGKVDMKWIKVKGGSFMMGSKEEKSEHRVKVRDFYMSKTEVTVGQYRKCIEAGVCSKPHWNDDDGSCHVSITLNYDGYHWVQGALGNQFRGENQPVVCIDWNQARTFAKWVGGDLPSEAQWEYAARSGGRDIKYPWGNTEATCKYAVMDDKKLGCGENRTWNVCSKIAGNTAQGLCDMGGNVHEWVLDEWHDSYSGAPSDDVGWCSDSECKSNSSVNRVVRGGSWIDTTLDLSATIRSYSYHSPNDSFSNLGFRVSIVN